MKAPDPADPINGKNGEDPSPEQQYWLDCVTSAGYAGAICWCASDAIDTIERYLDGRPLQDQPKQDTQ